MQFNAFDLALAELWAVRDEAQLKAILEIAARDHDPDLKAVEAIRGQRLEKASRAAVREDIATIPIVGPIFRYANLFTELSGATSIEITAQDLRTAVDDPKIKGILLNVDSPGGTVNGTNELSKMVKAAAREKPLVAYVSHQGASGAYWIASAARQIFADETALLGSIGVVGAFIDERKRDEARGIRQITFVSSQSPRKHPDIDSEEGRAVMQARVDKLAQVFIEAVAENRGVAPLTVQENFGQGDVLTGEEAVEAGMADAVSSYEQVLAGLAAGRIGGTGRRVSPIMQETPEMTKEITAARVAEEYPKAAAALRAEGLDQGRATVLEDGRKTGYAEGHKAGLDAGKADGVKAGAEAERTRIAALTKASLPGFEDLLAECIADGTSTAGDLALKQQAALKAQGPEAIEKIKADEKALAEKLPAVGATASGTDSETQSEPLDDDEAKTQDEAQWAKEPALRTEFSGNKDAFLAYQRAQRAGRITSYKRPAAA